MSKPVGQQGSWYARWDGEDIPCIHNHPTLLSKMHYKAPIWDSPERHHRYFGDIQRLGKVILTRSRLGDNGHYIRESYIALFGWPIVNLPRPGTSNSISSSGYIASGRRSSLQNVVWKFNNIMHFDDPVSRWLIVH